SSRSVKVNMLRTAGILSHRPTKIKCYDRLNSPNAEALANAGWLLIAVWEHDDSTATAAMISDAVHKRRYSS
ncbi:hypothetical protein AB0H52_20275, partial [Micromonospora sp. NPDC050695]